VEGERDLYRLPRSYYVLYRQGGAAMSTTYYVALPFLLTEEGDLVAG
jgi:phosphoserine aminotransferase